MLSHIKYMIHNTCTECIETFWFLKSSYSTSIMPYFCNCFSILHIHNVHYLFTRGVSQVNQCGDGGPPVQTTLPGCHDSWHPPPPPVNKGWSVEIVNVS